MKFRHRRSHAGQKHSARRIADVRGEARAVGLPDMLCVGVLSDVSWKTADAADQGFLIAAWLAMEDVGGTIGGSNVELLSGNSQSQADLAMSIARQWIDQGNVNAIAGLPCTRMVLAVANLGRHCDTPS